MERLTRNNSDEIYDSDSTQFPEDDWTDDMDLSTLHSPENNETVPAKEKETKVAEIDQIWNDIFVSDLDKRKEELFLVSEYQDLQKEVSDLRSSNAEKDAKISDLNTQVINLKKNICALYKTAKSEVEQKDILLDEANKKLDSFRFHRSYCNKPDEKQVASPSSQAHNFSPKTSNMHYKRNQALNSEGNYEMFESSRECPKREENRNHSELQPYQTNRGYSHFNSTPENSPKILSKQRLLDYQSPHCSKDTKPWSFRNQSPLSHRSSIPHNSRDQISQTDTYSVPHSCNNRNTQTMINFNCKDKSTQVDKNAIPGCWKEQSSQTNSETFTSIEDPDLLRQTSETNAVFFNLLPIELKQSFLNYERSQIEMLNNLKQSLISQHLSQSGDKIMNHHNDSTNFANHCVSNTALMDRHIDISDNTSHKTRDSPLRTESCLDESCKSDINHEPNPGLKNKLKSVKVTNRTEKSEYSVKDDVKNRNRYHYKKPSSSVTRQFVVSNGRQRSRSRTVRGSRYSDSLERSRKKETM